MKFKDFITERKTGHTKPKKLLTEKLIAEFMNFYLDNHRFPTLAESNNLIEPEVTEKYYNNALESSKLLKRTPKNLRWVMEGDKEGKIISEFFKNLNINKNHIHPADIWGISTTGLRNMSVFTQDHKNTPKVILKRILASFFADNLKTQNIIGVSIKETKSPTLKEFNYKHKTLLVGDDLKLEPVSFQDLGAVVGSNSVNRTTAMVSFKMKSGFGLVLNLNGKAKDLSIIAKSTGKGSQGSAWTSDLLNHLETINSTNVKLYGTNAPAPAPEPSEKILNDVIKRIKKSSHKLVNTSILDLKMDDFKEDGVMNVPAWKRTIIMISWVTMALENWALFSEFGYYTTTKQYDFYAPYWLIS